MTSCDVIMTVDHLGALQQLATMIGQPDARSTEEGTAATENAISAVAKILKYNSSLIDVNAVIVCSNSSLGFVREEAVFVFYLLERYIMWRETVKKGDCGAHILQMQLIGEY